MCIFSLEDVEVSGTNIFARMIAPGVQALAYGMELRTAREVAMVLPVPIAPGRGDAAMSFVNLDDAPHMFQELALLFEDPTEQSRSFEDEAELHELELEVHEVGSFVASYVPTRADFRRLDRRFRVPEVVFTAAPHYGDYGFAVFQLAPRATTVHPMAFTFPTRAPDKLFFPTVHVHDGSFHAQAHFDHALYYQHPRGPDGRVLEGDAVSSSSIASTYGGIATATRVIRRELRGMLPNRDTWISAT